MCCVCDALCVVFFVLYVVTCCIYCVALCCQVNMFFHGHKQIPCFNDRILRHPVLLPLAVKGK